jgi:hypothetical protein
MDMDSRREISSSQRTWRNSMWPEFPGAGLGQAGVTGAQCQE